MAAPLWTAHPECSEHVKSDLEARIRSFPPSFLLTPVAGEVFDNPNLCKERLQSWTLSQSFAIVQKSGSLKTAKPRFEFRCIHHGDDTALQLQNSISFGKVTKIKTIVEATCSALQAQVYYISNHHDDPRKSFARARIEYVKYIVLSKTLPQMLSSPAALAEALYCHKFTHSL